MLRAWVLRTGEQRQDPLSDDYGLSDSEVRLLFETVAELMCRAVRLGVAPCTGLSWRRGYGWPDCRSIESRAPGQ